VVWSPLKSFFNKLLEHHKITRAEEQAIEQQYTDLTVALAAERTKALQLETEAEIQGAVMQGASLLQTLGYRKAAAIVEAVWETAKGFQALGEFNFWSAAQHFMSAAEYGIIAGQSGQSASAAGPGAGSAGTGVAASAGAPSTQAVGGQASGGARVQIIFQGPVFGGDAGINELVSKVSAAVTQRDLGLQSYTAVRKVTRRA